MEGRGGWCWCVLGGVGGVGWRRLVVVVVGRSGRGRRIEGVERWVVGSGVEVGLGRQAAAVGGGSGVEEELGRRVVAVGNGSGRR